MNRVTIKLFDDRSKFISAEVFEQASIERIVGDVNYWIRIEVRPYWKANALRMEVDTDAPEPLRYMLQGLAIGWRMIPSQDPEDRID